MIVETPEDAPDGVGIAVLDKMVRHSIGRKVRPLVEFHEKSPAVWKHTGDDQNEVRNFQPAEFKGHNGLKRDGVAK